MPLICRQDLPRGGLSEAEVTQVTSVLEKRRQDADYESRREASEETSPASTLVLDSSLQNCEKINFSNLSHPVHGALLKWPRQLHFPPPLRRQNQVHSQPNPDAKQSGLPVIPRHNPWGSFLPHQLATTYPASIAQPLENKLSHHNDTSQQTPQHLLPTVPPVPPSSLSCIATLLSCSSLVPY